MGAPPLPPMSDTAFADGFCLGRIFQMKDPRGRPHSSGKIRTLNTIILLELHIRREPDGGRPAVVDHDHDCDLIVPIVLQIRDGVADLLAGVRAHAPE
eukprot:13298878-Heterocapsa_arctica.AAC.1